MNLQTRVKSRIELEAGLMMAAALTPQLALAGDGVSLLRNVVGLAVTTVIPLCAAPFVGLNLLGVVRGNPEARHQFPIVIGAAACIAGLNLVWGTIQAQAK